MSSIPRLPSVSGGVRLHLVAQYQHRTAGTCPLYNSRPQAGFPVPGDDTSDGGLDLNDLLVTQPSTTFFVRVAGDSMEGAGIFEGDILVVDRSLTPVVGSIVVAAVAGELTVKRLGSQAGRLVLLPENPEYPPLFIGDDEECHIWGVVTGSVRQFSPGSAPRGMSPPGREL